MSDWALEFALPLIALGLAAWGVCLALAFVSIRIVVSIRAPDEPGLAGIWFRRAWTASALAVAALAATEIGYQANFWEAPGIWGQPGRWSTAWGWLQCILPLGGIVVGILLDARWERRVPDRAPALRVLVTLLASALLIPALALMAKHAYETMG